MIDAQTTPYRVWIGTGSNDRDHLIGALNDPGLDGVHWPSAAADEWPVTFEREEDGSLAYSGVYSFYEHGIFRRHGHDRFRDGQRWDLGLFARFVASRRQLQFHPEDGTTRPTLAALSGLLRCPILVDEDQGSFHRVKLISPDGSVAEARCDGQDGTLDRVRSVFFSHGREAAVQLEFLQVENPGTVGYPSRDELAFLRQGQFREWIRQHTMGLIATPEDSLLRPLDFNLPFSDEIESDRPVMVWARTEHHLYEIIYAQLEDGVGPMDVMCAVDGELQAYTDPLTGDEQGWGAPLDLWCNWVLNHAVPAGAPPSPAQPWEGESTAARLYRLEHSIVSYRDFESSTHQFQSGLDLEAWIEHALGGHNLPFQVHVLDDVAMMLDRVPLPKSQRHRYTSEDPETVSVNEVDRHLDPWLGTALWQNGNTVDDVWRPILHTRMDGTILESYQATNCVNLQPIQRYLQTGHMDVDPDGWFVVSIGDTVTGFLVPASDAILCVSTDDDGARASMTVRNEALRSAEREREIGFHTRWASWLDESHTLTASEIREGLAAVGRLVISNGGSWS